MYIRNQNIHHFDFSMALDANRNFVQNIDAVVKGNNFTLVSGDEFIRVHNCNFHINDALPQYLLSVINCIKFAFTIIFLLVNPECFSLSPATRAFIILITLTKPAFLLRKAIEAMSDWALCLRICAHHGKCSNPHILGWYLHPQESVCTKIVIA